MDQLNIFDKTIPAEHLARPAHHKTSHEAARALLHRGIGRARMRALLWVDHLGGSTAAEIEAAADVRDGGIRKRLSDLRELGLAETGDDRPCRITGHNAQTWRVTPVGRTYLIHNEGSY
jgi:hypothetical protein